MLEGVWLERPRFKVLQQCLIENIRAIKDGLHHCAISMVDSGAPLALRLVEALEAIVVEAFRHRTMLLHCQLLGFEAVNRHPLYLTLPQLFTLLI